MRAMKRIGALKEVASICHFHIFVLIRYLRKFGFPSIDSDIYLTLCNLVHNMQMNLEYITMDSQVSSSF